jgi:hypothetical protein
MTGFSPESRAIGTDTRATSIRWTTFFTPVECSSHFEVDLNGNPTKEILDSVTEPRDIPSDEVLINYLEATRDLFAKKAAAAGIKFDVGGQREAEGLEMKYRLAKETLTGGLSRPDLLEECFRDTARSYAVDQVKSERLRDAEPEACSKSSFDVDVKRLGGAIHYAMRTATELRERFSKNG